MQTIQNNGIYNAERKQTSGDKSRPVLDAARARVEALNSLALSFGNQAWEIESAMRSVREARNEAEREAAMVKLQLSLNRTTH